MVALTQDPDRVSEAIEIAGAGPKDKIRLTRSKYSVVAIERTPSLIVHVIYIIIYKREVDRQPMLSDEERLTVVNVVASTRVAGTGPPRHSNPVELRIRARAVPWGRLQGR